MLRVLGPLEVEGPDGPVPVGGPVPRRILCALAVRPGAVVPVDSLLDAAWGDDPPPSAERTLISHITRLREALARLDGTAPPKLEHRGGGYRLVVAPEAVDAVWFEQTLLEVQDLSPVEAVSALREALAAWRPPAPFADLQDTAYPAAEAARLVELRGSAGEALVAACLDGNDAAAAAAEAEARLRDDPYRERLWELLVLALYRQGRQGDALEAYRRARAELSDGLGVDPGPRLRELEAQVLAQDPGLLAVSAQTRQPCPYKGLARYDAADADLFVGRERLVEELVARLVDERFLVVVGPSGAGKSSLVRAGLVPALAGGALPGSKAWPVKVMVPGTEPLETLEAALADRPGVLVVDQAEEALLADDGAFLVPFGDRLLAAVGDEIRVVLVLRADFFGLLAEHSVLARRAGPATVLVGPPDERELRRIISEPAARVGLRVEPALVDLVVAEVRDRPGALPVLSTALVRTWEHRDGDTLSVASYRSGGGVEAALQRVGEEAWAALDDEAQRAACRRLLLRLALNENGSWVRRWAKRTDLVRLDDPAAAAALAVLTDRRLVVARAEDVGIAHEALLTGWPRLHGWLEDGRSRADVRERLAVSATAWEQADHDPAELYHGTRLQAALDLAAASPEDLTPLESAFLTQSADEADRQLAEQRARADREARGRRRARVVAGVLAVTLAFAASAGGYAVTQQRKAQTAALVSDAARLGALARAGGDYDRSLLLAAQAVTLNPSPETESDLFATLLRGEAVVSTMRAPHPAQAIAVTPDSRSIVAVTTSGDLMRWPAEGGPGVVLSRLAQIPGAFNFNGIMGVGAQIGVARDGRIVVGVSSSQPGEFRLQLLDADASRVLQEVPANITVGWTLGQDRTVVVAAAGSWAAPSSDVLIWRVGAAAPDVRRVPVGGEPIRIAMCGADIACVLTARELVRVRLSDATVERRLPLPPDTVDPEQPETAERLVGSPDGKALAMVSLDGRLRVLDARTGRLVRELIGASRDLHALAFSPDGSRIVAGDHASVLVWRTDGSGLPERHEVHGGRVVAAEWFADGSTLATLGRDGGVVLLDMTGRRRVGAVLTEALDARTTTLWATPRAIVVGQVDGRLQFVELADGVINPAAERPHGTNAIDSARSGLTGDLLVTADYRGGTAVWDVATRRLLGTVELPEPAESYVTTTWVSPDGKLGATIRSREGAVIFDMNTRRVLRRLPPLPPPEAQLAVDVLGWTPDGRSLLITRALSSTTSDLLVVDATSGEVRLRADTKAALPTEAVADPAGRFMAVGTLAGTLLFLDANDGHALAPPLQANDGPVLNVSISPNGRYVSTSGQPPRLAVWDTQTFRQVAVPLPLDVNAIEARARFAPDGRLVVTSGSVLRAFTIDPTQWLARACREAGRTLTREEFEEVLPGRPYTPACA
jgi:DNA-binding SARP family transcriptional activator/WD40 repeat protein